MKFNPGDEVRFKDTIEAQDFKARYQFPDICVVRQHLPEYVTFRNYHCVANAKHLELVSGPW